MSNYKQRVAVAKGQEKIIFLAFITWKIRLHMRSTSKSIQNKLYCRILNILQCKIILQSQQNQKNEVERAFLDDCTTDQTKLRGEKPN